MKIRITVNIQHFVSCKTVQMKKKILFLLMVAENIDREYTLQPPRQSMFKSKNKKKVYPCKPRFYYKKWAVVGLTFHGHVIMSFKTGIRAVAR